MLVLPYLKHILILQYYENVKSQMVNSAETVLTAHKEHVRKLGVDRAISTMSGR